MGLACILFSTVEKMAPITDTITAGTASTVNQPEYIKYLPADITSIRYMISPAVLYDQSIDSYPADKVDYP